MYIWERPDWPHFRWDANKLAQPLAAGHLKQGRLLGRLERLGFPLRLEAELQATTEEALKNAEIEGEILDRESVRSSVAPDWVSLMPPSVLWIAVLKALSR